MTGEGAVRLKAPALGLIAVRLDLMK
jgi:hypothetical protein